MASAVARTLRICSGFAPKPESNSFISTENTTSNFFAGSPEKMLADAVPLMLLILPWNVLSPTASSRMLTSWPSLQIGAIEFADLGDDLQFGQIEHIRNRHTGLHLVAFPDIRDLHARE